jgi:hypothetical protein
VSEYRIVTGPEFGTYCIEKFVTWQDWFVFGIRLRKAGSAWKKQYIPYKNYAGSGSYCTFFSVEDASKGIWKLTHKEGEVVQ